MPSWVLHEGLRLGPLPSWDPTPCGSHVAMQRADLSSGVVCVLPYSCGTVSYAEKRRQTNCHHSPS